MTRTSLTALLVLTLVIATAAAGESSLPTEKIQSLLDAGQVDEAIGDLDRLLKRNPTDAAALFLRSTANIMNGDLEGGRRDLEASLEADPSNRQAWLNRAALDLAEESYDDAVSAFLEAERLDPSAPDNSLNIGAALLLGGDRQQASARFKRYLSEHPTNADSYYLVSANYAMASRPELAVPILARAIQLNEQMRLRARTDANFGALLDNREFQELLSTDGYSPPAGAFRTRRSYDVPYTGRDSRVLDATLTALHKGGYPIGPGVEVTAEWALIWSDMRIKVSGNELSGTDVTLSADPDGYTPTSWQSRTDDVFRRIALELSSRRPAIQK